MCEWGTTWCACWQMQQEVWKEEGSRRLGPPRCSTLRRGAEPPCPPAYARQDGAWRRAGASVGQFMRTDCADSKGAPVDVVQGGVCRHQCLHNFHVAAEGGNETERHKELSTPGLACGSPHGRTCRAAHRTPKHAMANACWSGSASSPAPSLQHAARSHSCHAPEVRPQQGGVAAAAERLLQRHAEPLLFVLHLRRGGWDGGWGGAHSSCRLMPGAAPLLPGSKGSRRNAHKPTNH